MEAWKTRTAQSLEVKVSDGILIKLKGKYESKPMLFWRYLAARTINEMVKKPPLRSAVACYLSGKGRHIELNLFELSKIGIYFRSHTFLYNIGQPFFLFRLIDMWYSWRNMTRISGNVINDLHCYFISNISLKKNLPVRRENLLLHDLSIINIIIIIIVIIIIFIWLAGW